MFFHAENITSYNVLTFFFNKGTKIIKVDWGGWFAT